MEPALHLYMLIKPGVQSYLPRMNSSKPYKQRILDFLDKVGVEGADNAKIRTETGIPSYQQVYLLTQELAMWRAIAVRRQGRKRVFYPIDAPSPDSFRGHWRVISSSDLDREILEAESTPFVKVVGKTMGFAPGYVF